MGLPSLGPHCLPLLPIKEADVQARGPGANRCEGTVARTSSSYCHLEKHEERKAYVRENKEETGHVVRSNSLLSTVLTFPSPSGPSAEALADSAAFPRAPFRVCCAWLDPRRWALLKERVCASGAMLVQLMPALGLPARSSVAWAEARAAMAALAEAGCGYQLAGYVS